MFQPAQRRSRRYPARIARTRLAAHKTLAAMTEIGPAELVAGPHNQRARLVMLTPMRNEWVDLAGRVMADLQRDLELLIGAERTAGLRDALAVDWGAPPSAAAVDGVAGVGTELEDRQGR